MVREGQDQLSAGVPDAGVRASELLLHVIRVAAIVVESDAVQLRRVGTLAKVGGR